MAIAAGGTMVFLASAKAGAAAYWILNEPFLNSAASTTNFTTNVNIDATTFAYSEDSVLTIQGQGINHTDKATLTKQP